MQTDEMIPASDICSHYQVELSFIHSLYESGLVEVVYKEETAFVPATEMPQLEKFARLHYDMDINLEGIETICHLLKQIDGMQRQIVQLNNRLSVFEK